MSGFKDGATDLDDLFMLYQSGTKVSATGFTNSGIDLADRYQPYTTGTKRGNTGFVDGSTDIAQLFQASNEPLIYILDPWYTGNLAGLATWPDPGDVKAGFQNFNSDGTFTRCAGNSQSTGDTWLNSTGSGNGDDFYMRRTAFSNEYGSHSATTNLTTTWQKFSTAGPFYCYLYQPTIGNSGFTVTISISPNASTTGEVTWTGTISCLVEDGS